MDNYGQNGANETAFTFKLQKVLITTLQLGLVE